MAAPPTADSARVAECVRERDEAAQHGAIVPTRSEHARYRVGSGVGPTLGREIGIGRQYFGQLVAFGPTL